VRLTPFLLAVAVVLFSATVAVATSYLPAETPPSKKTCIRSASIHPCVPRFQLKFHLVGKLRPRVLPRRELTPIAYRLKGKIFNVNGTAPPALQEIELSLDRHISVDAAELPACDRRYLVTSNVAEARHGCRESMVGTGVAHVAIESDSGSRLRLPLSLFSGGVRAGRTTLLLHSAIEGVQPRVVMRVSLEKAQGRYGLEAVVRVPTILGEDVVLLDFDLKIRRFLAYKGARRHFALARCVDDFLQVRLRYGFVDGETSTLSLLQPCVTRG
jgi:hypothetical protein